MKTVLILNKGEKYIHTNLGEVTFVQITKRLEKNTEYSKAIVKSNGVALSVLVSELKPII